MKFIGFVVLCTVLCGCMAYGGNNNGFGGGDRDVVSFDIHMKLSDESIRFIENELAPMVNKLLPHNDINFTRTIPHITLYMTLFQKQYIDDIMATFKVTASSLFGRFPYCNITMNHAAASGAYYLWHSSIPQCLQSMSDAFVESLSQFRVMDQKVPSWLNDIPEPQRSEMIKLQKMYGSPSVMSYFDPHITIAWDDQEPLTPLDSITLPAFNITVAQFAVGMTTAHGAVLRDHDLIAYPPIA